MDWVASSLTRRFGICIGLAWAGFLAVGVVSEQLKTRFQDVEQEQEVVLANGIRYYDLRVGGGDAPRPGDLVVIDLQIMSHSAAGAKSRDAKARPASAQPHTPLAAAAGSQARG